jgi:FkbM family methyltransferase
LSFDLRRSLRRAVRKTGFRRQIAPTFVQVMHNRGVDVVLDIGANDGDFGREIRDEGYAGRIVSFEPNPQAFGRLSRNIAGDPLWDAYQLGVGDVAGQLTLSVSNADVFSSFKPINDFGARTSQAQEAASVQVEVVRLDSFLRQHSDLVSRTYLKIDTQGFEMEVLRGAGDMLGRMAAVQAELGLIKTYQNEDDWLDVVLWMRARGFEIGTTVCNSAIREAAQVREFDFVFVQRPKDGLPTD